jgi:hypothetical protein
MIHESGARRETPFVAVNCGAIPTELMESELFGHRRGSFTGAVADKKGLIQAAEGGGGNAERGGSGGSPAGNRARCHNQGAGEDALQQDRGGEALWNELPGAALPIKKLGIE